MDNTLKKKLLNKVLPIFLLLFVFVFIYYYLEDTKDMSSILSHVIDENPIKFNYESGFYDKTLELKLTLDDAFPNGAKIYYTLDGNDPTKKSNLYDGKIELKLDEETKVYPLKTIVYYKGEYSNIYSNTYIIDKDIKDRFDMDVISITSDEYNLYDYYYGILVKGYTYQLYSRWNSKTNYNIIPGNYNNRTDDWIRDCHLDIFSSDGVIKLNDDLKFGVSGAYSSALDVKSFKIVSNENDKIKYDFSNKESNYSLVNEFNALRLRTSFDYNITNIKSSLFSRLAEESNFDGFFDTKRAILFLNGEYYGIVDVEETFADSFLGKKFNIKDNENIIKQKGQLDNGLKNLDAYQYFKANLDKEENREVLEQKVDIDNYLLYMAIEFIANNTDWPGNNTGMWYYNGKSTSDKKYTDGRIRFFLYDLDNVYILATDKDRFIELMGKETSFSLLMKNKKYQDKFITIISDLINTSFSDSNLTKIIDEELGKIMKESSDFVGDEYVKTLLEKNNNMKNIAIERNKVILQDIIEEFNLKEKYQLSLKVNNGIKAYWNNMEIFGDSTENTYNNSYFKGVDIEFNYELSPGYDFDYWLVNGNKVYDDTLVINDKLIKNGKIEVELVSKRNNKETIVISEINAKDDSDWIKLVNVSDKSINLNSYYLSDDNKKTKKYQLPNATLKPNETIIINGNKNYYAIGEYICNFNLHSGETLVLYNNGNIIDKLTIPRMSNNETYGRYLNSNNYKFYNNENNARKM